MLQDDVFMYQALQAARLGQYTARPNPMVGALLVQNGEVIAQACHAQAGLAHAEQALLSQLDHCSTADATLYVTLEPCTHQGKTPPCVDAIFQHPLKRIVIATPDPNPFVHGKGIAQLRKQGLEVSVGVQAELAIALNIGFFTRMIHKRPFVRAKVAMSLDGKVAMASGESQWITSEPARLDGHLWRAKSGAVLTTAATLKQDNCQLTVRHPKLRERLPKGASFTAPIKVLIDQHLDSCPKSNFFAQGTCLVAMSAAVDSDKQQRFLAQLPERHAVSLIPFPLEKGHIAFTALLQHLAECEVNEILIEAGPTFLTGLLEANLIDELLVYTAPDMLGQQSRSMQSLNVATLADKQQGAFYHVKPVGRDLRSRVLISHWAKQNLKTAALNQELLCSTTL